MKQILRKSAMILAVFGIAMMLSNCQNEPINADSQAVNIPQAKVWFDSYQSSNKPYYLFEGLVYNWDEAEIQHFPNGKSAIKIPAYHLNESPDYYGKKFLYIYPQEDKTYKVTLYEMFPNRATSDSVDMTKYTGYLLSWDLSKGFVRGAKFYKNNMTNEVALRIVDNSKTCLFCIVPPQQPDMQGGTLDTVTVTGSGGSGTTITVVVLVKNTPPPISVPVYVSIPYGGGSAAASASATPTPAALVKPCEKIKAKLKEAALQKKLEELRTKTNLHYESGFLENSDGTYTPLKNLDDNSLDMNGMTTSKTIGFNHCHLDDYEVEIDGETVPFLPIRMFSPDDLMQFQILVRNAHFNNIPLDTIYGNMVTNYATYTLTFTGDVNAIITSTVAYNDVLDEAYKNAMKSDNKEEALLNFIKDNIGISGILLARTETDGTVSIKTLDANNKVVTNPCN